jgi:hypothetical protein
MYVPALFNAALMPSYRVMTVTISLEGMDQRKRHFSFLKVLADGLAKFIFAGDVVQGVVGDLKGRTEPQAESGQGVDLLLGGAAQDRARGTGRRHEDGCLFLDDGQVFRFGDVDVAAFNELKDLAFGHDIGRGGHELDDGQIVIIGHELEGLGVEKVADQDARCIAPDVVGRDLPAPGFGLVDHVVVQKRRRVDEFDYSRQGVTFLPPVTAQIGADQKQQRPEALTAAADEVLDDFGNQADLGAQVKIHAFLHTLEIIAITLKHILHLHKGGP